jgi:hypothetical protein
MMIIFVAKLGFGLGCMGLGLLRDDQVMSRIATFIKGTSRDLINNAHSTTKMQIVADADLRRILFNP